MAARPGNWPGMTNNLFKGSSRRSLTHHMPTYCGPARMPETRAEAKIKEASNATPGNEWQDGEALFFRASCGGRWPKMSPNRSAREPASSRPTPKKWGCRCAITPPRSTRESARTASTWKQRYPRPRSGKSPQGLRPERLSVPTGTLAGTGAGSSKTREDNGTRR